MYTESPSFVACCGDDAARSKVSDGYGLSAQRWVIVDLEPHDTRTTRDEQISCVNAFVGTIRRPHYAAYVVRSSGDPAFVDLGDAAPLESAIETLRRWLHL